MQSHLLKSTDIQDLVEINVADYKHDADKMDFFGNYAQPDYPVKLQQSTNKKKVKELLRALNSLTCWEKPIFDDNHLPYYAMTAYLEDKISREQISQLLEFHELKLTYPDIITIPILTSDGQFTHASMEYFSFLIKHQRANLPNVSNEHLEKFRLSLLECSGKKAESFFVLYFRPSIDFSKRKHIGIAESRVHGSIDNCSMGDVFMPGLVRNIFYPAITPKNSTKIISIGQLGKFDINTMEKNHRKNIRPHALSFPGTFRSLRVHDSNVTLTDATGHDATHQAALSYFPEHLYQMSLYCLDLLREKTKIKWSEELWPMIDMFVIDGSFNIFNEEVRRHGGPVELTYTTEEALSDADCQKWITKLLKAIFLSRYYYDPTASDSAFLFNMILHDMMINESIWKQWIDVKRYIEMNIFTDFHEALKKPLNICELAQEENIQKQIMNGWIANWKSITESILGQLLHFEKNSRNQIIISLFGESIQKYSSDELRDILRDIDQKNLAGIELLGAAESGKLESLKEIMNTNTFKQSFDYILHAFKIAARHGHAHCVEYLLTEINKTSSSYQPACQSAFIEAAAAGHTKCMALLASHINGNDIFMQALHKAVKHRKTEVIDLLLEVINFNKTITVKNILFVFEHDDQLTLKKLLVRLAEKNKIGKLFKNCSLATLTGHGSAKCIPVIMEYADIDFKKLFAAIAKKGDIKCADAFIKYINTKYENDDIKKNQLLMECMLQGFIFLYRFNRLYFGLYPYNLHHDMVKLQIDQYLISSAYLAHQDALPKQDDIKRLMETLFSTLNMDELKTAAELPLHYLMHHETITSNKDFYAYCSELALNLAIQHEEPYYLRILLRTGIKPVFSQHQNGICIQGIAIDSLPSEEVRCLVWLAYAIHEIQQFTPNILLIQESLQKAASCNSFKNEMFSLIYDNSVKMNLKISKLLLKHLDNETFCDIKNIITERIVFMEIAKLETNVAKHGDFVTFNHHLNSCHSSEKDMIEMKHSFNYC